MPYKCGSSQTGFLDYGSSEMPSPSYSNKVSFSTLRELIKQGNDLSRKLRHRAYNKGIELYVRFPIGFLLRLTARASDRKMGLWDIVF
jgi:hypothetical protein